MKKSIMICILIIGSTCFLGCLDKADINPNDAGSHNANVPKDSRFAGVKIQSELKTPDGLVVKIWVHRSESGTEWIEGLVENPTDSTVHVQRAGILYECVDERSLDKNKVWRVRNDLIYGSTNVRSRYSEDFQCYGLPNGVTEIRPYIKTANGAYPSTAGLNMDPYNS